MKSAIAVAAADRDVEHALELVFALLISILRVVGVERRVGGDDVERVETMVRRVERMVGRVERMVGRVQRMLGRVERMVVRK